MRFINGKQRYAVAGGDLLQHGEKAAHEQSFRGYIKNIQLALVYLTHHAARRLGIEAGVEKRSLDAKLLQCLDLILHQRDQR